jgi:hypothetical protein
MNKQYYPAGDKGWHFTAAPIIARPMPGRNRSMLLQTERALNSCPWPKKSTLTQLPNPSSRRRQQGKIQGDIEDDRTRRAEIYMEANKQGH